MDKPIPNSYFKFISFNYKFHDFFLPCMNILKEVGIKRGSSVYETVALPTELRQ
jgi:hypothetical protein